MLQAATIEPNLRVSSVVRLYEEAIKAEEGVHDYWKAPSGRMVHIPTVDAHYPDKKISALKEHRNNIPGLGLKEAKEDIDAYWAANKEGTL